MRDVLAAVIAVVLLLVAASLATTLHAHKRRRQRLRDSERALGRAIVAEIPAAHDLILFCEDAKRFYYGERSIDKDLIVAVRMLINGSPIAAYVSERRDARGVAPRGTAGQDVGVGAPASQDRGVGAPGVIKDEGGIVRDQWDVAMETEIGPTLVECGSIRERVSQELARAVFEAVKRHLERRDAAATQKLGT